MQSFASNQILASAPHSRVWGDTVPTALQRRVQEMFGVNVREAYGMTESSPLTINTTVKEH
jgi:acyl-CoA synthetase (AMP-forming)/AMP-acid ligase II